MGQLYIQRFENWGAVDKDGFDGAWGVALERFAKTGNWGGVESGIKHIKTYGTSWGGYVIIEVENPEAFQQYQMFHYQNYAHYFRITFEPVVDADAAFAETIDEIKAKSS